MLFKNIYAYKKLCLFLFTLLLTKNIKYYCLLAVKDDIKNKKKQEIYKDQLPLDSILV